MGAFHIIIELFCVALCHNVYGIVGLRIDAGFMRPVKNLLRNLDWKCTFLKHTVCRTVINHCPVKGNHITSRTGQPKIFHNNSP